MKFYTLAMILFIFNISLAIINYVGVMSYTGVQYQSEWINAVGDKNDFLNQSYTTSAVDDTGSNDYGNFKKGLSMLVKTIFYATVGFPFMFHQFGLDAGLCVLLAIPIYAVYIFGLLQFFSKQGFEGIR
jgi:hypothetical protein